MKGGLKKASESRNGCKVWSGKGRAGVGEVKGSDLKTIHGLSLVMRSYYGSVLVIFRFLWFLHAAAVYTMKQHLTHCYRPFIQVRSVKLKRTTFLWVRQPIVLLEEVQVGCSLVHRDRHGSTTERKRVGIHHRGRFPATVLLFSSSQCRSHSIVL